VSPPVRYEASVALARTRPRRVGGALRADADTIRQARTIVDDFLQEIGATEIAISSETGEKAIDAAMTDGKAVGHPAPRSLAGVQAR